MGLNVSPALKNAAHIVGTIVDRIMRTFIITLLCFSNYLMMAQSLEKQMNIDQTVSYINEIFDLYGFKYTPPSEWVGVSGTYWNDSLMVDENGKFTIVSRHYSFKVLNGQIIEKHYLSSPTFNKGYLKSIVIQGTDSTHLDERTKYGIYIECSISDNCFFDETGKYLYGFYIGVNDWKASKKLCKSFEHLVYLSKMQPTFLTKDPFGE